MTGFTYPQRSSMSALTRRHRVCAALRSQSRIPRPMHRFNSGSLPELRKPVALLPNIFSAAELHDCHPLNCLPRMLPS